MHRLISSLLASTHIPLFMDGRPWRALPAQSLVGADSGGGSGGGRGGSEAAEAAASTSASASSAAWASVSKASSKLVRTVDGGLLEFIGVASAQQLLSHGVPEGSAAVTLEASRDDDFMAACREHGWSMLKPIGTEHFIGYGERYVESQAALGAAGALAALEPYRRQPAARRQRRESSRTRARRTGGAAAATTIYSEAAVRSRQLSLSGAMRPPSSFAGRWMLFWVAVLALLLAAWRPWWRSVSS